MSRYDRTGADRANLYDEITDKIVAELEAGRVPWVQPWGTSVAKAPLGLPRNAADDGAHSRADLGVGRVGCAAAKGKGGCAYGGCKGKTQVHGSGSFQWVAHNRGGRRCQRRHEVMAPLSRDTVWGPVGIAGQKV